MEWILYIVIGVGSAGVGSGLTAWWFNSSKPKVVVVEDKTSEKQQDVVIQLTDLDLVKPVCSPEFVSSASDLLCREWICRMMQRGIDAKTSQVDCNEIANVANKIAIHNFCKESAGEEEEKHRKCIEFFDRRI